jgi:hypothetical protein
MSLKINKPTIQTLQKKLKRLPVTVAVAVASRATPEMTTRTQQSFTSNRTVYGDARPNGEDGKPLTLRKSGATETSLRFVNEGSRIRCQLGPRNKKGVQYGRFLIGKYEILPNKKLPLQWSQALARISETTIKEEMK